MSEQTINNDINNDVNRVTLVGSVFKDPDIRIMPSGDLSAKFVLSTTKHYKFKGEDKRKITFHIILAYGKLAENIEFNVRKYSRIKVEGSINNRKWRDTNTGTDKYITEIIATTISDMPIPKDCTPEEYVSARLAMEKNPPVKQHHPKESDFNQDSTCIVDSDMSELPF